MRIKLTDVSSSAEKQIFFDYSIDLSQEEVNYQLPFCTPVLVRGSVADRQGALLLSGAVLADARLLCARCNRPVESRRHVQFEFLLSHEDEQQDAEDVLLLDSDSVDIDQVAASELILDIPMAILCSEDCLGLCFKCGKNLNDGDCGCDRTPEDSPFDVLKGMDFDNK